MPTPPPKTPTFPTSGAPNAGKDRPASRPPAAPGPVDSGAKTRDFLQAAPSLEIPKGGGAVRGMGEKFQANPVTGTSSFSIPVPASPGRGGFQPQLALSYDSGAGNGPFGLGWSLAVPHIQRKTDRGIPRYRDDDDVFVISDAEDLIPCLVWNGSAWAEPTLSDATEGGDTWKRRRYRPRVESAFSRIERWTHTTTGVVHWRSWSRENVCRIYGLDSSTCLADPDDITKIFAWYLEEERDERGNRIRYDYQTEDPDDRSDIAPADPGAAAEAARNLPGHRCTNLHLKQILYGNVVPGSSTSGWLFQIALDYSDPESTAVTTVPDIAGWWARPDVFSNFRAGFDVRCYRRCRRILVFHRFADTDPEQIVSTHEPTLPLLVRSLELDYNDSPVASTLKSVTQCGWSYDESWTSESLPALEFSYTEAVIEETLQFMQGLEDLPKGLDLSRWQWVDLDGEGLTGLLAMQAEGWFYKRNNGAGRLAPARRIPARPSGNVRWMDLDGDGRMEAVSLSPGMSGYYARDPQGDWEGFRPLRKRPSVNFDAPETRLIDLDGDGQAEVMVTENACITWYDSEGTTGWDNPERVRIPTDEDKGPRALLQTDRESIFWADMSGDGLADVVRIRNGSICYWPNRGYGRFGAKIQMSGAPWFDRKDRFDPRRIRLADIDGSGPADLIYLGPDHVRIWRNQAGNSWSDAEILKTLPGVENPLSISVADLRGDGTACLVWASPLLRDAWSPLRYIRLMSQGKPWLLRTVKNNLGRSTTLHYAPSTQFMVSDREAGKPWATRLPFPVQCLEQVEVEDAVTGWRNVTRYAYHHGCYDSAAREFRGFGKVEQWDTESLGSYSDPERGDDAALDLDPVRTVSWFHTGAWRQQGTLEEAFAAEYWATDEADWPLENVTEDAPVEGAEWPTWTPVERREAARALKGKLLRQEIYAEDGSESASLPYAVTATTWTVARVQPLGSSEHAGFTTIARESLARHYERVAEDPRSAHELTLSYDACGTVTKKATVGYPRRDVEDRREEQNALTVLVAETSVAHDTDSLDSETDPAAMHWHVGVTMRSTAWHLTSEDWQEEGEWVYTDLSRFSIKDLNDALDESSEIPFEEEAGSGIQRRAVSVEVKEYWKDDLSGPATTGTMEGRALLYQSYRKAISGGLATEVYPELPPDMVWEASGYVELEEEDDRWAASGIATPDDTKFYQVTTYTDPFGNNTEVEWDEWSLFPLSVTDTMGNTVVVTMDPVSMQPASVEDPNGNITRASYDALGRVIAVAIQGKDAESLGDTLEDPTVSYSYELGRFKDDDLPARTVTTQRTEHDGSDFLVRYSYSDGAGKLIQEKVSAEDGEVPGETGTISPRWVGTGRTVLNNKELPVKQYEPFFSATEEYEFEDEVVATGVSSTVYYDPPGRATKVKLPNGCIRRVLFDAWKQEFWDENDCATDSDCMADSGLTALAADHTETPTKIHLDHLGRPIATEEYAEQEGDAIWTVLTLDVAGNPTAITDARSIVTQAQVFDLLGRPIHSSSPDAGDSTVFLDVAGQPLRIWKSGDLQIDFGYDDLRRKTKTLVTEGSATPRLVEVNEYGESEGTTLNHRGKLWRQWDTAGRVEVDAYDFKGNPLSSTRRFWDWEAEGEQVTWGESLTDTPSDSLLEAEEFTVEQSFDALNRPTTQTTPDGSITEIGYNQAALFESVGVKLRGSATLTPFVVETTYNARGQREQIDYGNGVSTGYSYDADTFRLDTLETWRESDGLRYQKLAFTYDPVGNIVGIEDSADSTNHTGLATTLYFANGAVTADQDFTYDALYRLTEASGREKTALAYVSPGDEPAFGSRPDLSTAVQRYTQSYSYDGVGNILEMDHFVGGGSPYNWTREYSYAGDSNRLEETTVGAVTDTFAYDDRGSIVYLPNLKFSSSLTANIETDFRDQIRKAHLATSGHYALYFYDAAGQRVRKVVVRGTATTERIYVGGVWERYREYDGSGDVEEETETLHVMDGGQRVAMVETKTVGGGSTVSTPDSVQRYQLGNHLGTVAAELDEDGEVISYEEYHPYGTTAWQAPELSTVSQKRYRYTGMERDEESGLQCHGVRYYVVWLGRWGSCDPIGVGDGVNRYGYAHSSPVSKRDASGLAGELLIAFLACATPPPAAEAEPAPGTGDPPSPSEGTPPPAESPGLPTRAYRAVMAEYQAARTRVVDALGVGGVVQSGFEGTDALVDQMAGGPRYRQIDGMEDMTFGDPEGNERVKEAVDDGVGDLLDAAVVTVLTEGAGKLATGFVAPRRTSNIRFTQDSIGSAFRNGDSVDELVQGLRNGTIKPTDVPPIRVFERDGVLYSLDNQRLYAFKHAGVEDIPTVMVDATDPDVAREIARKMTTNDAGQSVIVRSKPGE